MVLPRVPSVTSGKSCRPWFSTLDLRRSPQITTSSALHLLDPTLGLKHPTCAAQPSWLSIDRTTCPPHPITHTNTSLHLGLLGKRIKRLFLLSRSNMTADIREQMISLCVVTNNQIRDLSFTSIQCEVTENEQAKTKLFWDYILMNPHSAL